MQIAISITGLLALGVMGLLTGSWIAENWPDRQAVAVACWVIGGAAIGASFSVAVGQAIPLVGGILGLLCAIAFAAGVIRLVTALGATP